MKRKIFISVLLILGWTIAARAMGQAPEVASDTSPGTTSDIKASEVLAQTSTGTITVEQITSGGRYFNPEWSPDRDKIYAVKHEPSSENFPGIWNLVVMDKDGTNEIKLSDDNIAWGHFNLSNNEQIVYVPTGANISLVDSSGTVDRLPLRGGHPMWNYSGDKIFFTTERSIFVTGIKGTDSKKIVETEKMIASYAISLNGEQICFNSEDYLWVINVDGSNKERLARTGWVGKIIWEDDLIYYGHGRAIWVFNLSDNKEERILYHEDKELAFGNFVISPNSEEIYYVLLWDDGHRYYCKGIWRANSDGTSKTQIVDLNSFEAEDNPTISVSSDGKKMVYSFQGDLFVVSF